MSMYDIDIDWNSLLSPISIMPPDISLKIIPVDGREEDGVVVKAHRMVLSLLSPVLKIHLSEGGDWENTGSDIILRDVSPNHFKIMLKFFYEKDFELSQELSIKDLFELIKVADKFEVLELVKLSKEALKKFPINLNSVVDSLKTAKAYNSLLPFEEISEEIIKRSSDWLFRKVGVLKNALTPEVLNSVAKSDSQKFEGIVGHVEAITKIIKYEQNKECNTCGVVLIQDGKFTHENVECKVIKENMVAGARVVVTHPHCLEAGQKGEIKESVKGHYYTIKWDCVDRPEINILSDHVPMKYIRG